jgi:hypothetical protein
VRARRLRDWEANGNLIVGGVRRVEHVHEAKAGLFWVVAFHENIIRREARAGRYGAKAGHDA